ncbi:uncharacterized protein LOC143069267 isoform X4 [Mytilus galloprovincialis]|uniref:uncharacterized protein LOC143069267 isoform X4 n=1 Tax=Mytilus galloprovincialis TaxID=29158 RepID=UPI003F7BE0FB
MMNERYDLCKCCHAQTRPGQNIKTSRLDKGQETLQDLLVHKIFEDIDGLKRSIWLMSPGSTTKAISLVSDVEPDLGDFVPIIEMTEEIHPIGDKLDVKAHGEVIEPDLDEIEADVHTSSSINKSLQSADQSLDNCVKCPVRIVKSDNNNVNEGRHVFNTVHPSNCYHSSPWRQPGVGRRIIANFNQVTEVRSTNNLRDQVNQQTISSSGKTHSHTTNICGSTMEGKAVLSHSNNSAFVNPTMTEDNMEKLSDINHNSSEKSLSDGVEVTINNNNPTQTFNCDEDLFTTSEPPPCECDDCMLENTEIQPKPVISRQSSVYWKKMKNIVIWSPFIQQFKKHRYPWIQLAGHQGNFQAGEKGSVLKKYDSREQKAFLKLNDDILRSYVPEYRGVVAKNADQYLELQDLLCDFDAPFVMDIKMGTRTYLEEELVKAKEKPKPRKDMYQKMVEVDPSAPTPEENKQKSIIKPRYMQWRDEMSSSVDLGFRIEGIKRMDGASSKNFKKTKTRNEVKDALSLFIGDNQIVLGTYIRRLKAILATQETSKFFKTHELIGSSLLFVHDKTNNANVWMIDFGKTEPLPSDITTNHRTQWVDGNHEDGYLFGLDNLLLILQELETTSSSNSE